MQLICHVPDDRYVKISYYLRLTSIPEDTSKPITLKNTVEMTGQYTATATEDTKFRYYTASGTVTGTPGVLTLSKQNVSGNTLTDAKFSLYHVVIDENQEYLVTAVKPVAGEQNIPAGSNGKYALGENEQMLLDQLYYYVESKAPEGYVCSETPLDINIPTDAGTGFVVNVSFANSLIPHTGGMGTTLFSIVGGALIATAGVVFFVSRRKKSRTA